MPGAASPAEVPQAEQNATWFMPKDWDALSPKHTVSLHSWYNPTAALITIEGGTAEWRARAHRKGRHPLLRGADVRYPPWNWFFVAQPRNISWWVAHLFVWGSVAWVVNGFFLMWKLHDKSANLKVTSASAMIGGTLFEIGALFAYWEAINVDHTCDFGSAIVKTERRLVNLMGGSRHPAGKVKWRWFGADWHSLGFVAAAVQLAAATIFWISVIVGLPGVIFPDQVAHNIVLYWTPQIVGGSGFVIASTLLMLEEQPKWYRIQPLRMGWHVGFWNWIGGLGFTLSGIFGLWYTVDKYQKWGTAFSSFWGGWAFLIGSYVQLLEAINPHPRERLEGTTYHSTPASDESAESVSAGTAGSSGETHEVQDQAAHASGGAPQQHVNMPQP